MKKLCNNRIIALILLNIIVFATASLIFIFIFGDISPVPVFALFALVQTVSMVISIMFTRVGNAARIISAGIIGLLLFFLACLAGKQNFQIEGFFISVFSGVGGGVLVHYAVGKIFGPAVTGRVWCSWGCWNGFVYDLLPWKSNIKWSSRKGGLLRYIHFSAAAVVSGAMVILISKNLGDINLYNAVYWFAAGNVLYYFIGIILAIVIKDNRAFCKYVCPVAVFLKASSRFSIAKICGSGYKCTECGKCSIVCPSGILLQDYLKNGERVKSTECLMCLKCVTVCPEKNLRVSWGIDFSLKEKLKYKD